VRDSKQNSKMSQENRRERTPVRSRKRTTFRQLCQMGQTNPRNDQPVELTLRGLILGAAITLVFTAANVYLGLKVGLTFASSIPAAVISMAVLRFLKNSTIEENNIVQTVASAAGTLSSIIFVLPGLIMIGWWTSFPFWTSFGICAVGGILGVMYTIPLRRAMVVESPLPYPEGVAAAEVTESRGWTSYRNGKRDAGRTYFRHRWFSALLCFLVDHRHAPIRRRIGGIFSGGRCRNRLRKLVVLSFIRCGVRFIGAGTIGVAAIWTLTKMMKPIWFGLLSAFRQALQSRAATGPLPRTDQDIPITSVAAICLIALLPITILIVGFLSGTPLQVKLIPLTVAGVVYVVVVGFLVAAICGYMAGLISSSNSPLSGVGILAVIGAALVMRMCPSSRGGFCRRSQRARRCPRGIANGIGAFISVQSWRVRESFADTFLSVPWPSVRPTYCSDTARSCYWPDPRKLDS
jgi:uncharacterized oligopeptide transporter (OPT) family protein